MVDLSIIGAGRAGQTIAYLLMRRALVQIRGVVNQSSQSTLGAIAFMGEGEACLSIKECPHTPLIMLAVPDDRIAQVSADLSISSNLKAGDVVFHLSGFLSSEQLFAVKQKGCFVASIHPMRSFSNPALSVQDYSGTYCAMEGDPEALNVIGPLFKAIGSQVYVIDKEKKALYHAAGVFASNYVVTLSHQALHCLLDAGVDQDLAMHVVVRLMQSTVSNLEQSLSPRHALTGPLQRGDLATVQAHLDALPSVQQKCLYALLGRETLSLTGLTQDKKQELDALLMRALSNQVL